jgi:hypothetical protein
VQVPRRCAVALIDEERRRRLVECEEPLEAVARQRVELTSENLARQRRRRFDTFVGDARPPSPLPFHSLRIVRPKRRGAARFR